MKPHRDSQVLLNRQASEWVEILRAGRERDAADFAQWLAESPRHVRDYLLMEGIDAELAQLDAATVHGLRDNIEGGETITTLPLRSVTPVESAARRRIGRQTSDRWAIGLAAGLAVMCFTIWNLIATSTDFKTALGEQRTVELQDGSLVQMNTLSHLRVRLSEQARDVQLIEGDAVFKVRHEALRPFRVHAGDTVIEAVGTEFYVRRGPECTLVSVVEGKVRTVTSSGTPPIDLAAGDRARIDRGGKIAREGLPDLEDTLAWRQRRLVFREESLGHIATEFNRYNRAPQLHIEGTSLQQRQFSGVFNADDPESLIQLLSQYSDLTFAKDETRITVRSH